MGEKFEKLRKHIQKEYQRKGYGKKRSKKIGYATAAKVFREKEGY